MYHFEHPTEEALERFALNNCEDEELERLETHILACEFCTTRLESLDTEVSVMKIALADMQRDAKAQERQTTRRSWTQWFSGPRLAWSCSVLAVALAVAVVPRVLPPDANAATVNLSAYRGLEFAAVPVNKPLRLRVNAVGLDHDHLSAQMVNSEGSQVWSGPAELKGDTVELTVPKIRLQGPHYLRLYARDAAGQRGELLREFALQAK
jgi:hypothetical protein